MKKLWFLLILFALLVRIIPAIKTPVTGDLINYFKVGQAVLRGENPYTLVGTYPYPPVWMWWEAVSVWTSKKLEIPFQLIIKIPLILADLLIALLILKLSGKKKEKLKILLFLFYIFNPVSILITGFHGQFDQLVILLVLLAIYSLNYRKIWKSALFLSLSIVLKIFPILLLPFFLMRLKGSSKEKIKFGLLTILPTVLILLPFIFIDFKALLTQLFSYSGVTDYGFIAIIRAFYSFKNNGFFTPAPHSYYLLKATKYIFLLVYVFLIVKSLLKRKKSSLLNLIALTFCLFYFFYGGISSQYLIWILPFLIITDLKNAFFYTIFASLALIGFYSYFFPEMIFWLFPSLTPTLKIASFVHLLTEIFLWSYFGIFLLSLIKKFRLL